VGAKVGIKQDRLWVYMILPAVILNLGGVIVFGIYYGLASQRPEIVAGIGPGQFNFVLYLFINVVEWLFAISIIRKLRQADTPLMGLIAPRGDPWKFRWAPAVLLFFMFNAIFFAYFALITRATWTWSMFEGLNIWQRLFLIGFIPVSAGFCEEVIWRGYIITRLEARGRRRWPAILLSATSFALIHGLMPDKLLVTFLIGIVTGLYFTEERNLIPLMVTHAIVDLWSFGLFLFVL